MSFGTGAWGTCLSMDGHGNVGAKRYLAHPSFQRGTLLAVA